MNTSLLSLLKLAVLFFCIIFWSQKNNFRNLHKKLNRKDKKKTQPWQWGVEYVDDIFCKVEQSRFHQKKKGHPMYGI